MRLSDSIAIACVAHLAILSAPASAQTGVVAEAALREMATRIVMPICPQDRTGIAARGVVGVGQVEFDNDGIASLVTILEAPSPSIAQAMSKALKQWEIKRGFVGGAGGEIHRISSRVTFYFLIENDTVVAMNPTDVGYIGRWTDGSGTD